MRRKHIVVQLCVRKDKSRTVIGWGFIEDLVSWEKCLQGRIEKGIAGKKNNLQFIYLKLSKVLPIICLFFSITNKVKIQLSLNFWLLLATKHDSFISSNTCYFLVWTKYTCMVETFEMLIALINDNSNKMIMKVCSKENTFALI